MGKITDDDKNKVRNFIVAVQPELEKMREHIAQCGLDEDQIVDIAMTGKGYFSITFHEVKGAYAYRCDVDSPMRLEFKEIENVPV